jgi:flavin reductase (DIM6/NTAB) family NADH-FMN oxidoreductase RutF
MLKGTAVSFDCRITNVLEKGTHTIFFTEVEVEAVQSECETKASFTSVGVTTRSEPPGKEPE